MKELRWKGRKELEVRSSKTHRRSGQEQPVNRLAVCRDLQPRLKSETPKRPERVGARFRERKASVNAMNGNKNHIPNAKRAFKRRIWRFYKSKISLKRLKAPKAQEAWLGRKKPPRRVVKMDFKKYLQQLNCKDPPKSHKARGFKVPYRLPMRFATLNVRGLNGDNGITKRQLIVETMKRDKYDVMLLSETQVNCSSSETHGDYLFFFSTDVPHDKKDREYAGVGIVVHKKWQPCIHEIRPICGRLILCKFRSYGINFSLLGTYAPHSGHSTQIKEDFYDTLQSHVEGSNEVLLVGGDFNARLHHRYPTETDALGPNIFGRGREYLEQVAEKTRENRDLFMDFCRMNSFVVLNTLFDKPLSKQATYREVSTHIGETISAEKHAQLDFWLIKDCYKNCCVNVQSRTDLYLHSDHYPLEAFFQLHLKAQCPRRRTQTVRYQKPSATQFAEYNAFIRRSWTHGCDHQSFNDIIKEAAEACLVKSTRHSMKKNYLSRQTWGLIDERQSKYKDGDHEAVCELNQKIKTSARNDRRNNIANNFKEDPHDRQHKKLWKVVSHLRKDFKPNYIAMRDTEGRLVPLRNRAETIATYLESKHWVNSAGLDPLQHADPIGDPLVCNEAPFILQELAQVLKAAKIGKQPGPDTMIMELYKWLDAYNRVILLDMLNSWWSRGAAPSDIFHARVVPIYKKGKTDDAANYRPISLLNSIYKIYCTLIRNRVQEAADHKVSATQYGFRPNKSTAHAAYIIRRIQDWSEQKSSELHLALLDWEKAFDKVQHNKLFQSLERLGFTNKYVNTIRNIYSCPTFFVEDDYGTSSTKVQKTGIRQGCPLSPYLFLLVMTCIDKDVGRHCSGFVHNARLPGLDFNSVYYADDTILFSTTARALNELISHVEKFSEQYGLRLNRAKCCVLHMNKEAVIHFSDHTLLPKAQDAVYLGNNLNHTVNIRHEVIQRIVDVKRTWLKLHVYWRDQAANRKWQLLVYDAVIRSRLLYGLETVHLTKSLVQKINAFHHKGLRKILRLTSTYIDRRNTNAKLFEKASAIAGREIIPFSKMLEQRRVKLAGHVLRTSSTDPMRQISYQPDSANPCLIGTRRVGRPRQQWLHNTNALIYTALTGNDNYMGSEAQTARILQAARDRII